MRSRFHMSNPPLSTLDLVCLLMDCKERPLDFALFLHFDRDVGVDALGRGACSARNLYPSTRCSVVGDCWSPLDAAVCEPAFRAVRRAEGASDLERFIRTPFRLATEPPLRQLWVSDARTGGGCLITRIHHCAADLLSGLVWIRHQLRVATGLEPERMEPAQVVMPTLANAPPGAKRNPGWKRCDPLWTRPGEPSGERCWTTFSFEPGPLLGLSRTDVGFTFNDVLTVAVLDTLHEWNCSHGEGRRKVGIWLPVNIRRDLFTGFGNASSRIRVRRDYPDDSGLRDRCRAVRSQVDRARERGEWVVPQRTLLTSLPLGLSAPLARRYLNRPWADMGSAAFSHVQRWPGHCDPVFDDLRNFGVLGAMHRRHALMLVAVTRSDRTWLTITYDPALLLQEDIDRIRNRYLRTVVAAAQEL